jgi:hypothetical protein
MIEVAENPAGAETAKRDEYVRMINEKLAKNSINSADVDLICALNDDGALDADAPRVRANQKAARARRNARVPTTPRAPSCHRSMTSAQDEDVQIAQAYLRHHPITDIDELRVATVMSRE